MATNEHDGRLLVEVETGAHSFVLSKQGILLGWTNASGEGRNTALPSSTWGIGYSILGIASDMTEDQAEAVVDGRQVGDDFFWAVYRPERIGSYAYDFATESLASLCRSLGLDPACTLILKRIES